jgi:hypothetical protein
MSTTFNPFARHMVEPDPSAEAAVVGSKPVKSNENRPKPGRIRKSPPAPRLLYWLQNFWTKPIICLRDIYIYGPYNIRKQPDRALAQAELLEQAGWLIPLKAHRSDRRVWRTPMAGIGRNERKY